MGSIEILLTTGLVAILSGYGVSFVVKRKMNGKMDSLAPILQSIREQIDDLKTTPEPEISKIAEFLERLEAVERRVEVIHKDAIRHLQKASAAENRARRYADDDDDGTEMTREEAEKLLASEKKQTYNNDENRQLTLEEIERFQ